MRLLALEVHPAIFHRALGGREEAGHDVERRRLAGAIGPDQADDFALRDMEVHIGNRDQAAEMNGDVFDAENCISHHACSSTARSETAMDARLVPPARARPSFEASDGTMPRGITNRMTISTTP